MRLNSLRAIGSRILPPQTRTCVSPPGRIKAGSGNPIIVASIQRSGTHALIDLILNNFTEYRKTPLYIDFDRYVQSGLPMDSLIGCGAYVVKTHYPHNPLSVENQKILGQLAQSGSVVRPDRPLEDIFRSLKNFEYEGTFSELKEISSESDRYWSSFAPLRISFHELVAPEKAGVVIERIAGRFGLRPRRSVIPNPHRSEIIGTLFSKMVTRVIGKYSPRINTTIRFATTQIEKTERQ